PLAGRLAPLAGDEVAGGRGVAGTDGRDHRPGRGGGVPGAAVGGEQAPGGTQGHQHGAHALAVQVHGGVPHTGEVARGGLLFEAEPVRADDLAELLRIGFEEVRGGPGERRRERGQRRVGRVDADADPEAVERRDQAHVLVHRQAGGEGAGEHHAVSGGDGCQQELLERRDLGGGEPRPGLVELRGRLRGREHGEVRAHPARDLAAAVREPGLVEEGQQRVTGGGGEHGQHRQAGALHPEGDVDALAPGLDAVGRDTVHAAGRERAAQVHGAVQGRVRGEGDDHAIHTSIPASPSRRSSGAGSAASVTSTSTSAIGAKVTRWRAPIFVESASITVRPAARTIAVFTAASSGSGVVKPWSSSPLQPRKATAGCRLLSASTVEEPTAASVVGRTRPGSTWTARSVWTRAPWAIAGALVITGPRRPDRWGRSAAVVVPASTSTAECGSCGSSAAAVWAMRRLAPMFVTRREVRSGSTSAVRRGTAPPWTRTSRSRSACWSRSRRMVSVVTSKCAAGSVTVARPLRESPSRIWRWRSLAYIGAPASSEGERSAGSPTPR